MVFPSFSLIFVSLSPTSSLSDILDSYYWTTILLFLPYFDSDLLYSLFYVFEQATLLLEVKLIYFLPVSKVGEIGGSLRLFFFFGLVLWTANFLGTKYFRSRESIFFFFMYSFIKLTNTSSWRSSLAVGL